MRTTEQISYLCMQPNSPLQTMQEHGEGWLLGAALLQRPQLVALQQLLIKGLFNPDTQLVTVKASPSCSVHASYGKTCVFEP